METKVFLFEQFLRANSYDFMPYDISIEDSFKFILTFDFYFDKLSIDDKFHYDYCFNDFALQAGEVIRKIKKYNPELLEMDNISEFKFYERMFELELIYDDVLSKINKETEVIFNQESIKDFIQKYDLQSADRSEQLNNASSSTFNINFSSNFYNDAAEKFVNNWFEKYPGKIIDKGMYAKACAILDATYDEDGVLLKGISKKDYFTNTLSRANNLFSDLNITDLAIKRIVNSIGKPGIKKL